MRVKLLDISMVFFQFIPMRWPLAILSLHLLAVLPGFGAAVFFKKADMVRNAVAIAIIEMEEPRKVPGMDPFSKPKREDFYSQAAKVKVIETLKGTLPDSLVMYGGEHFICAQCTLKKGRYIAFFKRDGELWAGANWQNSLRPVTGGKVDWWKDSANPMNIMEMAPKPVNEAIAEVRKILNAGSGSGEDGSKME